MNLNKAMLIGNLTKDPEVKTTPTGQTVATFSIATNFVWNDQQGQKQEKVEFHNIVAWRRLAEICGQYLKKGSKVYLEGRLQTRNWVGQDGLKRYMTEIIAENMIMLDRAGSGAPASSMQAPTPIEEGPASNNAGNSVPVIDVDEPTDQSGASDEEEIKVENIPF